MSQQTMLAVGAVFAAVALLTAILLLVGRRARGAHDAARLALGAADVVRACEGLLTSTHFIWSVWHDTANPAAMRLLIRDAQDSVITDVLVPSLPLDGVLKRFTLDDRHYEIRKAGLMSTRSCLYETGARKVLLSADHTTAATTFFEGDGARQLFEMSVTSALTRYRPIVVGGVEVGRLIKRIKGDPYASVLALPAPYGADLVRVFVLATL